METQKQLFAKIVATPTQTSWSQAYNAGSLYAVLSLHIPSAQKAEDIDLHILGKQVLDTLEQEFFTLEEKNLATIKQAVLLACQKIPDGVTSSFSVVSIPQNPSAKGGHIMYVFLLGKGKIVLKRGEKIGTILRNAETLTASSGFLQDNDFIVLETAQFAAIIPQEQLFTTVNSILPDDMAETFAPKIHEIEEGGACAIFVAFQKPALSNEEPLEESRDMRDAEEIQELQSAEPPTLRPPNILRTSTIQNISQRLPKISLHMQLTHRKKLFLTIAVVIFAVFISSIYFTIKKKADQKTHELFQSVVDPAQKKFEEGNAIAPLNTSLAKDDYQQAKDMLSIAITKFPKGSSEQTEASALLKKITNALSAIGNVNAVQTKNADVSSSPLLTAEIKNPSINYFTQDDKTIYSATQSNISSIDKSSQKEKILVKNKGTWSDIGGLGTYLTNLYILDKKSNQIYKFIANDSGFSTTSYLGGSSTQDFSKAVSLTVDTSIWVLLQDGTILRFTRGNLDPVTVSGLEKKLASPTKIFTNTDTTNVYLLDIGNKRIVVLSKTGAYQAQYQADIIKSAKGFDVLEKDKKIFVLSGGKIYEIDLK